MTLSRKLAQLMVEKNIHIDDVMELLGKYKLTSLLPSILKAVAQLGGDKHAADTLHIESPFALSSDAVAKIKRIVGNDMAAHVVTINTKLLAGFRARFKGKLYDGSAERIINQFTK
jgi:F0F1-type ATP synthase delta subunit